MSTPSLVRISVIPRRTESDLGGSVACHAEAPARHAAGRNGAGPRRLLVAAVALAATLSVAGCSGSSGHGGPDSGPSNATGTNTTGTNTTNPAPTSTVATRWWSNGAASAGSTIDPSDPTAAAGKLHPDRSQYCSMLKQTLAAGKSILPGAAATDPRLLASTEAFLTELQHVAPVQVSRQWKTLGDALIQFVKSAGKSTGGASTATITAVAQAISTDAKSTCHVDISATGN